MASGRRRRFGYAGWVADFIGLIVLLIALLWGIHKWNAAPHHWFGMPNVPLPGFTQRLPAPAQRWLSGTVLSTSFKPALHSTPTPVAVPTPAALPSPSSVPAATPEPSATAPATPAPEATPIAALSPSPSDTPSPRAVITTLKTTVRPSANSLQASATALYQGGGLLCLGLADGGVAIRDGKTGHGIVVPLPKPGGAVRAVTLSPDRSRVWWIGSDNLIYAYDRKTKALRSVQIPSAGPAQAIAVLTGTDGETVAVLGAGAPAARFFNGDNGRLRDASEILPASVAEAIDQPTTSLYFASDPIDAKHVSLLFVSGDGVAPGQPTHIALWTTPDVRKPGDWKSQEADTGTAPAYSTLRLKDIGRAAVDLNASGAALLARPAGGQTLAACKLWSAGGGKIDLHSCGTLPTGVSGLWAAPERIATGKSGLWWTFGGSVFHANAADDSKAEVYLPWNLPAKGGDKITALIADDSGAWVASGAGVHRITPALASATDGYGGYIRARLGETAGKTPAAPLPQKLAKTTQEWQGTPYKWGGDDKKGVDCSGYVSAVYKGLGVSLPRSTAELPTCPGGPRIRDELRYGDVLVFPGHCAVYMGNGWTSEAMTDAGVGKATIWTRKQVVVRRFLHL